MLYFVRGSRASEGLTRPLYTFMYSPVGTLRRTLCWLIPKRLVVSSGCPQDVVTTVHSAPASTGPIKFRVSPRTEPSMTWIEPPPRIHCPEWDQRSVRADNDSSLRLGLDDFVILVGLQTRHGLGLALGPSDLNVNGCGSRFGA
jgi:hypothetical protein